MMNIDKMAKNSNYPISPLKTDAMGSIQDKRSFSGNACESLHAKDASPLPIVASEQDYEQDSYFSSDDDKLPYEEHENYQQNQPHQEYQRHQEQECETKASFYRPKLSQDELNRIMRAILRKIKSLKNDEGDFIAEDFEELPDRKEFPEYYQIIDNLMCLKMVEANIAARRYTDITQFQSHIYAIVENANTYNDEDSDVARYAKQILVAFEAELKSYGVLPSEAFTDHGNLYPIGQRNYVTRLTVNGVEWRIGEFALVKNPCTPTPNVIQIENLFTDSTGAAFEAGTWFYFPSSTFHIANRRFYKNEVFKTSSPQYNPFSLVVRKCYVMFARDFEKCYPRDFSPEDVFVCESTYDQHSTKFAKIREWHSVFRVEPVPAVVVQRREPITLALTERANFQEPKTSKTPAKKSVTATRSKMLSSTSNKNKSPSTLSRITRKRSLSTTQNSSPRSERSARTHASLIESDSESNLSSTSSSEEECDDFIRSISSKAEDESRERKTSHLVSAKSSSIATPTASYKEKTKNNSSTAKAPISASRPSKSSTFIRNPDPVTNSSKTQLSTIANHSTQPCLPVPVKPSMSAADFKASLKPGIVPSIPEHIKGNLSVSSLEAAVDNSNSDATKAYKTILCFLMEVTGRPVEHIIGALHSFSGQVDDVWKFLFGGKASILPWTPYEDRILLSSDNYGKDQILATRSWDEVMKRIGYLDMRKKKLGLA